MAGAEPLGEFDAELERRVGAAEEIGLVEAKADDQVMDLRDRRFADPDRSDLIGFDERDGGAVAEKANEGCCGNPACSSAAGNDDIEGRGLAHRKRLREGPAA